ncbi:MAG: helix-turn-helix domain-containing protein [Treponema sp.]|nr:helix-turn-helix domain-containing protein [Treponema sp.]
MSLQETFIANLKYYRKQNKMTQNELTLEIDMGLNYINGVEQGAFFPKPEVIERIAQALHISPIQLFDESQNPHQAIIKYSDDIANKVSDILYSRIKKELKNDIKEALKDLL